MANNNSPEALIPELGDVVTIMSTLYNTTTGKIIYRDNTLIRVHQYNGSTAPVDFPLDPDTGYALEQLGVSEMIIHKKRSDPHFSRQLGTIPGEYLEFYSSDGILMNVEKDAIVREIIASDDMDAIVLEDGSVLDFGFVGVPDGIGIIIPHPPPESESLPLENDSETAPEGELADDIEPFPGFDNIDLPPSLVEEIASEGRTYSDSIQRTDMFTALFKDVPIHRQKDPKIIAKIYRISDVLLAMKNSVVKRDESGEIVVKQKRTYVADTIQEALELQPTQAPISALIPVSAVKKVVYTDDDDTDKNHVHVDIRSDIGSLVHALESVNTYASRDANGNAFVSYMNGLLKTTEAYVPSKQGDSKLYIDQDVLRSKMPPDAVEGFPYASVPKADSNKNNIPLTSQYLGNIQNRHVRLIGPTLIRNPNTHTNYIVAQADTAETVGHVVLSKELTQLRAPIRSSVLLWDIHASVVSREISRVFYSELMKTLDEQIFIQEDSEDQIQIIELLASRMKSITNYVNKETTSVLDSLGLRNMEWTPNLLKHMNALLEAGQSAWMKRFASMRKAANESLIAPAVYPVQQTILPGSSLLADDILHDETLASIIAEIKAKETLFETYNLVYANDILKYANGTLGPYWYALAAADETMREPAKQYFIQENGRIVRNTDAYRHLKAKFIAQPEINPCEHVKELEKIRGIRGDEKHCVMLDKFVKKYQAGQRDNFIVCGSCNENLICKHEILLIQEMLNPGRSISLHKSLLLEFGNGVFEGAYICKVCGQKIQDIEYDTHLEFDDEGRPLIGRTVIEGDETDVAVTMEEEVEEKILFKESNERAIYKLMRSLFERCGINATDEMYKRVVPAAKQVMEEQIIPESKYKSDPKRPIKYSVYSANMQVGIIGAFVLLELQTSDLLVPVPMSGIEFSRAGFPLDGLNFKTAGVVAVNYVTFGLAGLFINKEPWNQTSWAAISNANQRLNESRNAIMNAIFIILAIEREGRPTPIPIGTLTDTYKQRLSTWKEKKTLIESGENFSSYASAGDKLPPIFRPLTHKYPAKPFAENAIGNENVFIQNAETANIVDVGVAIVKRSHELAQQVMNQFHENAQKSGIVVPNNPRSDSTCCYAHIGAVGRRGLGVSSIDLSDNQMKEIELHATGAQIIKQRDMSASAAGTHIYVPWKAPYLDTVLPTPRPEDYYKLFLKNCFQGRNYGLPHEISTNGVCRHCKFAYPHQLFYAIGSELSNTLSVKDRNAKLGEYQREYEELARAALETSITIDEASFRALEAQIRARKQIHSADPLTPTPFLLRIRGMLNELSFVMPPAKEQWQLLITAFDTIITENIQNDLDRKMKMTEFARGYDGVLNYVNNRMNQLLPRDLKTKVSGGMDTLSELTSNVIGGTAARNILQLFVVGSEQISNSYSNTKPRINKWFPNPSKSHTELLEKIWDNVAETTSGAINELKSRRARGVIINGLKRFSSWLGSWMNIWINEFRPSEDVHTYELVLLLRWVILTGMQSLLNEESPLYADAESADQTSESVQFMSVWIIGVLTKANKNLTTYQLSPEQIEEAIHVRAEKERAQFIKKFDDLDSDLRKVELIKKKLKIGDWSVGNVKNLFNYDADFFEFERSQRAAMGVPDFDESIAGVFGATLQDAGMTIDVERDNLHYADDGEGDYAAM